MARRVWKYAACTAALFSALAIARPADQPASDQTHMDIQNLSNDWNKKNPPPPPADPNPPASQETKDDIFHQTYQYWVKTHGGSQEDSTQADTTQGDTTQDDTTQDDTTQDDATQDDTTQDDTTQDDTTQGDTAQGADSKNETTDGSKVASQLKLPVKSYVAFGDSFTANPSEYEKLPDPANGQHCYRTTASWANKLAADPEVMRQPVTPLPGLRKRELNVAPDFSRTPPSFDMEACTGYTSVDMRQKQITGDDGDWDDQADVYTITVGGNDVDFAQIVKTCVYNLPPSVSSALYSMLGGDSCEAMLDKADKLLDPDGDVPRNISALFSDLKQKILNPQAIVVVVPYIQFYNTDTVRAAVTEGSGPTAVADCRTPLARRKKFFDLTNKLNKALADLAQTFGFVYLDDADLQAGFDGHRFCEPVPEAGAPAPEVWINDSMADQLKKKDCAPAPGENINAECAAEAKEWDSNVANTIFHPNGPGTSSYKEFVKGKWEGMAKAAPGTV